ncbi:hypothetical protein LWC34_45165 [Kibdelosporangium philippinense]|uniref:Uncharacterized protein n=1 Tax=Kibdelosporangium philippinense TaxID=211113 RepID=A0ABS8ZQF6_9PSEU|nr:hypothetical protein [Kibdelosporangium philippinense]MCE7009950.1 hypothetical protein [Kibdelosporangium philippinense]
MSTAELVLWGTNPNSSVFYAARVHVVSPDYPWAALCGLPVELVWQQRPATPHHQCPECCLIAIAWFFPASDQQSPLHSFINSTDAALALQNTLPQAG